MAAKITTKERILDLLKRQGSVTVNELTDHLSISHMAVRKHLDSLQKDNIISSKEIKQPIGRPLQMYLLTDTGDNLFPKNYEGLTLEFLEDMKELYGEDSIQKLFQKREERLTTEYTKRLAKKTNKEKIHEIANIQNEKGYMADVTEIDAQTFELIEYNCPIMAVANEFKTACQCETNLFKNVLGTKDVRRVSCKTDGNDHCKFLIQV
ncbi:transcriptional regulator [Robertmurraya yapensis]|uniref:Transcriptional regulator n=1 Tax=Bacillus yapensis TaxID=2492960 RepID=A0A3S0IND9_9BACI|nr:metalloregulator ArsR/SmtB family transcription factor [Bacillus yapensis]RTR36300.1 transcriptional regulator [Bacillus yapensis]TKT05803.1 DeoR family transcriptional regulator [Bacillus yapensis]